MNPIKNIEIKNFKSIRHVKIEDCRRINVFIGYPNVGKSNLLEALSLFSIRMPMNDIGSILRMEKPTTLFFDGNVDAPLEIIINGRYQLEGNYIKDIGDINFSSIDNLNSTEASDNCSFKLKGKAITNWEWKARVLEEKELYPIKRYEFKKNLLYEKGPSTNLASPFGENIFNVIYANDKLTKQALELFEDYQLELIYDSRDENFLILKKRKGSVLGFTIPYDLIADTLRRVIFYKAAIRTNNNTVLLFEEPEAHMFPPYMKIFTTDVIFNKSDQFFIATHSPYVLESFMMDAEDDLAVYLISYEDGETRVKLLHEKDIDEIRTYGVDLFYNLESYLKHGQVNHD
jgi:AAA15 family ATPase/GTPase